MPNCVFWVNHPPQYQVGQAFQPDVRLESLTYGEFDILAGRWLFFRSPFGERPASPDYQDAGRGREDGACA
jgi:hypothetical protein